MVNRRSWCRISIWTCTLAVDVFFCLSVFSQSGSFSMRFLHKVSVQQEGNWVRGVKWCDVLNLLFTGRKEQIGARLSHAVRCVLEMLVPICALLILLILLILLSCLKTESQNPDCKKQHVEFLPIFAAWKNHHMDPHLKKELLSQLVPSQWGFVHLFDLCLWFGHVDTALALALHGVEGCKVEDHHLGTSREADVAPPSRCDCEGWTTCSCCCWGFADGIWMKDWDQPLTYAAETARKAAKTPLVSGILEIFTNEPLPLVMSEKAAARLLDIAILRGNQQAAVHLARSCPVRPLRRWRGSELCLRDALPVLSAALLAGANFKDLYLNTCSVEDGAPLLLKVALELDNEHWQKGLGRFFESKVRWPNSNKSLGNLFLCQKSHGQFGSDCWLSMEKIQNALKSGWDLKYIWTRLRDGNRCCDVSLLDLAILCGQSDCANTLVTAGVRLCSPGLFERLKRICCGESLELCCCGGRIDLSSTNERQQVKEAATEALLQTSFKREGVNKGVAVYQLLANKFYPRGVPFGLVHHILGFSMEWPKSLNELDATWRSMGFWYLDVYCLHLFIDYFRWSLKHYAPQ